MTPIPFTKMTGSGNDFIIIDNRDNRFDTEVHGGRIAKICRRALSVGADGFILIEDTPDADFKWQFFTSDGSVA